MAGSSLQRQFLAFPPSSCSGSMHILVLGEECGDSRLDICIHDFDVMTFVLCMGGLAPPVFEVLEAKVDSLLPVTLRCNKPLDVTTSSSSGRTL